MAVVKLAAWRVADSVHQRMQQFFKKANGEVAFVRHIEEIPPDFDFLIIPPYVIEENENFKRLCNLLLSKFKGIQEAAQRVFVFYPVPIEEELQLMWETSVGKVTFFDWFSLDDKEFLEEVRRKFSRVKRGQ